MGERDPRVDAYISEAASFAQPILKHLREIVHSACPGVQETIKWRFPHFDHKGILCGMAAFKAHCALGFWKASLIMDGDPESEREAMGHFGKITTLADLPPDKILVGYVRKAAALNEAGVKAPNRSKPRQKPAPLEIPDYFSVALRKNKKAQKAFDGFSYSHRKEYVEWITEAKRDATRERRLATALEWLAEGKPRNWKHLPG
jgi:uncharacterized protein YdeI (YjbR/CyaY-like superfamily)